MFIVHDAFVNSKMWKQDGIWACTDCDYTSKNNSNVYEHISILRASMYLILATFACFTIRFVQSEKH